MENTEILSMVEREENFEIIEEFLEEENHVFEVGKEFKEVVGTVTNPHVIIHWAFKTIFCY